MGRDALESSGAISNPAHLKVDYNLNILYEACFFSLKKCYSTPISRIYCHLRLPGFACSADSVGHISINRLGTRIERTTKLSTPEPIHLSTTGER